MTDCIFLLADGQMEAVFRGFLERSDFDKRLHVSAFTFETAVAPNKDPGVYNDADIILRPYQKTHRFAVVVLDNDWEGSPGIAMMQAKIAEKLLLSGWEQERFEIIVINPELENWIWQDSPHIAEVFRFKLHASLREWLREQHLWESGDPKPARPKEAVEKTLRATRTPVSGDLYRRITARVGIRNCLDPAFQTLCAALQLWFPPQTGLHR